MSKGTSTVQAMQKAGFKHFPKQWWSSSKEVKKMYRDSIIVLDSATCSSFFNQLEHYLYEEVIVWAKFIHVTIANQERCMGLVGKFSEEAYNLLSEKSM